MVMLGDIEILTFSQGEEVGLNSFVWSCNRLLSSKQAASRQISSAEPSLSRRHCQLHARARLPPEWGTRLPRPIGIELMNMIDTYSNAGWMIDDIRHRRRPGNQYGNMG
jgi:hypothetical protein